MQYFLGGTMKKPIFIQVAAAAFILLGLSANLSAENLPRSGSISINAMFKGDAPIKFNNDYSHYTSTGVTFNEAGSGPLHMGKAACAYANFTRKEINKGAGFCAFEDKEGDSIFIQYAGAGTAKGEVSGAIDIIGGSGKFEGISGSGTYACTHIDKKSEFPCTEKFDYQLPE
jgi:hypothetical protein